MAKAWPKVKAWPNIKWPKIKGMAEIDGTAKI